MAVLKDPFNSGGKWQVAQNAGSTELRSASLTTSHHALNVVLSPVFTDGLGTVRRLINNGVTTMELIAQILVDIIGWL